MLNLGTQRNGKPFELPTSALVQTFAILAIRGAGKTCAATVMAEEMYKANLPWICLDPVGVWWGLRAKPDGEGNGIPVVIFGGEHADLPLAGGGKKIADALMSEPICAVLDVSQESKRFWHTFLTDFCLRLMELNPDVPRHLFIEEAPEFVPQRTKVDLTARCKEAVERLIRLGRNRGYGCTLISQRPATVDKDVLSQCENLFVMRTVGPHDRKALQEWIEVKNVEAEKTMFNELPSLPNGAAYFWSPHWQHVFMRMLFRRRETFHPGETREIGKAVKAVRLTDVAKFVERLKPALEARGEVRARGNTARIAGERGIVSDRPVATDFADAALHQRIAQLDGELGKEREARRQAEQKIERLRQFLKPQFEALSGLFTEIGQANHSGSLDRGIYEPWLQKAGQAGCRRLLETLLDRPELTRNQLGTLAGLSSNTGTFRNYLSWLKRNGLIEVQGDTVKLRAV